MGRKVGDGVGGDRGPPAALDESRDDLVGGGPVPEVRDEHPDVEQAAADLAPVEAVGQQADEVDRVSRFCRLP